MLEVNSQFEKVLFPSLIYRAAPQSQELFEINLQFETVNVAAILPTTRLLSHGHHWKNSHSHFHLMMVNPSMTEP